MASFNKLKKRRLRQLKEDESTLRPKILQGFEGCPLLYMPRIAHHRKKYSRVPSDEPRIFHRLR
jgi:hypothetical protein